MANVLSPTREHARAIWDAAVAAANPFELVRTALARTELRQAVERAGRILVVGGGKAGAAMSAGAEAALADRLDRAAGVVNVPEGATRPLRRTGARKSDSCIYVARGTESVLWIVRCQRCSA